MLQLWKLKDLFSNFTTDFLKAHTLLCPIKDINYGAIKWGYVTTVTICSDPGRLGQFNYMGGLIKLSCNASASYSYLSAYDLLSIINKFELQQHSQIISIANCEGGHHLLNLALSGITSTANGFCFEPPANFSKNSGI